ncbi:MAG: bacteriocin-protection protein, partial [Bdellovibrionota bacterium]
MKPKFFKSPREFRAWLEKNHSKSKSLLVGIEKGNKTFRQADAIDQAMCFGWIANIIKRIDEYTYMMNFMPRRPRSQWSASSLKRAASLKKQGLMAPAGLRAIQTRERHKLESGVAEFTRAQLKKFKANEKAWSYFSSMPRGYRYYMTV